MWPSGMAATYAGAGPLSLAENGRSRCAVGRIRAAYLSVQRAVFARRRGTFDVAHTQSRHRVRVGLLLPVDRRRAD